VDPQPPEQPEPPRHLLTRRGWLARIGWAGVFSTLGLGVAAFVRFMYPRVLFEPPAAFDAGRPGDYRPGSVSERFRSAQRVWIVRTDRRIIALYARCTHLGCTPRWLEAENKFKCPCHGSGFSGFGSGGNEGELGVHFEGPAPRPLERLGISLAADGTLRVDKAVRFPGERQWDEPGSYVEG